MGRNRKQTSGKIKQAAASLLCREGFENWGINVIAREAKVDKVLIYRYFQSLKGLLDEIIKDTAFWPDPASLDTASADTFIGETVEILESNRLWSLLIGLPGNHPCHESMLARNREDLDNWLNGFRQNTTGFITDTDLHRIPAMIQFNVIGRSNLLSPREIWQQVSPPLEWNSEDRFHGFEELPTELL